MRLSAEKLRILIERLGELEDDHFDGRLFRQRAEIASVVRGMADLLQPVRRERFLQRKIAELRPLGFTEEQIRNAVPADYVLRD